MLGWIILTCTILFFVIVRVVGKSFLPKPNKPVWITAILVVLALTGIFLTVDSSNLLIKSNAKKSWNIADGRIIKSQRVEQGLIMPMVVYTYEVEGRAYIDTTNLQVPGFGNAAKQNQVTEEMLGKYPPGSEVEVHYNPEDVSESDIVITPQWNIYGKIGLGVMLFGLALFFLLLPRPTQS